MGGPVSGPPSLFDDADGEEVDDGTDGGVGDEGEHHGRFPFRELFRGDADGEGLFPARGGFFDRVDGYRGVGINRVAAEGGFPPVGNRIGNSDFRSGWNRIEGGGTLVENGLGGMVPGR